MKDPIIAKHKNTIHKVFGVTVFCIISLIGLFLYFLAANFDNDKSCHIDGGIWNEEKSRCEDIYGNKWKF